MSCGRFWRSTVLSFGLLLCDTSILFGGIDVFPFKLLPWIQPDKGLFNSTSPFVPFLIGICTFKLFLTNLFILLLGSLNGYRYACDQVRLEKLLSMMLLMASWRVILSLFVMMVGWWWWAVDLGGQVGLALKVVSGSWILDFSVIAVVLHYKKKQSEWLKFNNEFSTFFNK